MCSSITSTTRSLSDEGFMRLSLGLGLGVGVGLGVRLGLGVGVGFERFMRPSSSNSCHALGTELWLVVHTWSG